jgi:hypothetical protein
VHGGRGLIAPGTGVRSTVGCPGALTRRRGGSYSRALIGVACVANINSQNQPGILSVQLTKRGRIESPGPMPTLHRQRNNKEKQRRKGGPSRTIQSPVPGRVDTLVVVRKFVDAGVAGSGAPPKPANYKLATIMRKWLGLDPRLAHSALYGAGHSIWFCAAGGSCDVG